jgi:hypothetical protein
MLEQRDRAIVALFDPHFADAHIDALDLAVENRHQIRVCGIMADGCVV